MTIRHLLAVLTAVGLALAWVMAIGRAHDMPWPDWESFGRNFSEAFDFTFVPAQWHPLERMPGIDHPNAWLFVARLLGVLLGVLADVLLIVLSIYLVCRIAGVDNPPTSPPKTSGRPVCDSYCECGCYCPTEEPCGCAEGDDCPCKCHDDDDEDEETFTDGGPKVRAVAR